VVKKRAKKRIAFVWMSAGKALIRPGDGNQYVLDATLPEEDPGSLYKANGLHLNMFQQGMGGFAPGEVEDFEEAPFKKLREQLLDGYRTGELLQILIQVMDPGLPDDIRDESATDAEEYMNEVPLTVMESVRNHFMSVRPPEEADFTRVPKEGKVHDLFAEVLKHYNIPF
jgi:hypothetical protein